MTRFFLWSLLLVLGACGSTPAPRQPQILEQALSVDREARRALRAGDLLRAQYGFSKELALQQSVDETAGVATTLINLATVAHQLRDDAAALVWLDRVVLEQQRVYPHESILTATFRKAVILANLGRLGDADTALRLAEKRCEKKCALRYGIGVLGARLLLLQGDAQGALTLAQALGKQTEAGREEQTNAVRVQAGAEEKLLRYADALRHYQVALEADKALGLAARIGEDLSGMARVAKLLGREEDAAVYARRASLASESQRQSGK